MARDHTGLGAGTRRRCATTAAVAPGTPLKPRPAEIRINGGPLGQRVHLCSRNADRWSCSEARPGIAWWSPKGRQELVRMSARLEHRYGTSARWLAEGSAAWTRSPLGFGGPEGVDQRQGPEVAAWGEARWSSGSQDL